MTTTCGETKLWSIFGKYWRFYAHSSTKMSWKMLNFAYFWHFLAHFETKMSIKSPICKISQKYSLTLFLHMLWSSGENFSHFEQKLNGVNRFAWDILKLHFCPEIYERSYQISEIEIAKIFEQNLILTFCKKQWLRLIEIF